MQSGDRLHEQHLGRAVAICLMLTIGIGVQLSMWDSMPLWHHFVFFASIFIGLFGGGWCQINLTAKPVTQMS